MISEGLWKRRFGARSGAGRRQPDAERRRHAPSSASRPPALALLLGGDIWMPLTIDPGRENRLNHVILAVGRLRRGVTIEQAQAEMDNVAARVGAEYPEVKDWGIRLVTFYNCVRAARSCAPRSSCCSARSAACC